MRKIFTFILALVASVGMSLQAEVIIDDIAYILDEGTKTATVTKNEVQTGITFQNYPGVTTISIPSSVKHGGVTYIVTAIAESAFFGCSSLTTVTIGKCVKTIGNTAFCNCYSLPSINIPNSVTSIGEMAFMGCSIMKRVEIGAGVKTIGEKAFWALPIEEIKCYAATPPSLGANCFQDIPTDIIVRVPEASENAYKDAAGWSSFTNQHSFLYYSGECGAEGDNLIWSLDDKGDFIIYGSGEMANWTGDTPWTPYAASIKRVVINAGATSVGVYAFNSCSTMTQLALPNTLTKIESYAFNGCSGLTYVAFPNGLTEIKNSAFMSCSSLASVTLPNSLTKIYDSAFRASGLTSIVIPNNVTNINQQAFYGCSALESLTIGNSVANIGNSAFKNCSNLASITCQRIDPPTCGNTCFDGVNKSIPVYVPNGTVTTYQNTAVWEEFTNIQGADLPTGIDEVTVPDNGQITNDQSPMTNHQSPMTNKVLRDGQLLILRDGKVYTVTGQEVK